MRYIIKRLATMPMFGLVDCGLHEQGVDELEVELQNIVDGRAPPPAIHILKHKRYLFLYTNAVEVERMEWRELFPASRLDNDRQKWRSEGKIEADVNNLVSRRHVRGCLVVDVKLRESRKVTAKCGAGQGGAVALGSAALLAGQFQRRLRQTFHHSPSGGDSVQLSTGETADHSVPRQYRDVLKEASSTAISFTIEDMELLAWVASAAGGDVLPLSV